MGPRVSTKPWTEPPGPKLNLQPIPIEVQGCLLMFIVLSCMFTDCHERSWKFTNARVRSKMSLILGEVRGDVGWGYPLVDLMKKQTNNFNFLYPTSNARYPSIPNHQSLRFPWDYEWPLLSELCKFSSASHVCFVRLGCCRLHTYTRPITRSFHSTPGPRASPRSPCPATPSECRISTETAPAA